MGGFPGCVIPMRRGMIRRITVCGEGAAAA
jgi:hypothetical protein